MKARVHLSSEAVSGNNNKEKHCNSKMLLIIVIITEWNATPTVCKGASGFSRWASELYNYLTLGNGGIK